MKIKQSYHALVICICDLASENRAYVHIKFDHFFNFDHFLSLKFHNFVVKHGLSIKLYVLVQHTISHLMQCTEFV